MVHNCWGSYPSTTKPKRCQCCTTHVGQTYATRCFSRISFQCDYIKVVGITTVLFMIITRMASWDHQSCGSMPEMSKSGSSYQHHRIICLTVDDCDCSWPSAIDGRSLKSYRNSKVSGVPFKHRCLKSARTSHQPSWNYKKLSKPFNQTTTIIAVTRITMIISPLHHP